MKKNILILAALLCFGFTAKSQATISSTFNSDNDGWKIEGDASSSTPIYKLTDGNPGGYISADDTESSGTWFFSAPNKFLGDLSTLYDKNIEFDLRQHSNMTNQYNHIGGDVIIEGNGLVIVFNTTDNPSSVWTSYSIPVSADAGWSLNNIDGNLANETEIRSVLTNVTKIKIRGEFESGPDIGDLDNVVINAQNPNGTPNENINSMISIYPNPATKYLTISNSEGKQINNITLFNQLGQIVLFERSKFENIDISIFEQGIYIIEIVTNDEKTFRKKIIKK